jgi:hypothetical protein
MTKQIDKEKENAAMKIFEMVRAGGNLPATLDKLIPLSFIGKAAVSFYREKLAMMQALGIAEEQRKATLSDGQDAGEMLLDIEARIGEIADNEASAAVFAPREKNGKFKEGKTGIAPKPDRLGISQKKMESAQKIHRNPGVVERIKAQARENEDIPTKTAVLNQINHERELKRRAEVDARGGKAQTPFDVALFETALDRMIMDTKVIPKNWSEKDLKRCSAKARIIINRLSVFSQNKAQGELQ